MVPTFGFSDQVTALLVVLVTVAVNCCVWPGASVATEGVTVTTIGGGTITRVTEAVWFVPPLDALMVSV